MRNKLIFIGVIFICSIQQVSGQNWDVNSLKWANRMDGKFIVNSSKGLANTEPFIIVGIPIAIASYGYFHKDKTSIENAIYIGSSMVEVVMLSTSLKMIVDRKRPYEKYPDEITARTKESGSSFPSNHTSAAFALATSLTMKYHKWYIIVPSYAWASSIGFARMNLGVHYTSDVVAGAALGSGCAILNFYLNKWLLNSYHKKRSNLK